MNNSDFKNHVKGFTRFIDDMLVPAGTLYAAVYTSPSAHARILNLNTQLAESIPGVIKIITEKEIPGENQIGNIQQDEPLLAKDYVQYIGQPIAVVIAENPKRARAALKHITCEFEQLPAIFNPREAFMLGNLIIPPRIISYGDCNKAWSKCKYIFDGTTESGGQEHLYLETQGSAAWVTESGSIKIISATQSPSAVQRNVSRVLNLPMNLIEVEVPGLGGAFGGKEDQATPYAAMAALAALIVNKPIKLVLNRQEDVLMTGKRHPYSSDFMIGLDDEYKILAYEVKFFQNSGAFADLSSAVMERSLLHCTNSYYIPNVQATGFCCRTNLPPNTAFRGFGAPQAIFVIESAIHRAAEKLGIDAAYIQEKNLLNENDEFPYGQKAEKCNSAKCWNKINQYYSIKETKKSVDEFNLHNNHSKKGYAVIPLCFGISFSTTFINQAGAIVHVYTDGSVSISTGAVEMGQGVNTKMRQIAAEELSISPDRIRIETTNTSRVANTSPTAASTGTDLNGRAVQNACSELKKRLLHFYAVQYDEQLKNLDLKNERVFASDKDSGMNWESLIMTAWQNRIDLSAHGFYSTPGIYFNQKNNKGKPFFYHVYGAAIIEATLDCIRGTYKIDSVKAVHDAGKSINPVIDRGQAEGAIVQGIGWVSLEQLVYDDKGNLLSKDLSSYKIPDLQSVPDIEIHFLEDSDNPQGILNSKAVGEPPFIYGLGAFFAVRNALKAVTSDKPTSYKAPLTNERVLLSLLKPIKELIQ